MNRFRLYLFASALALAACVPSVSAQNVTGAVAGEITDSSGADVPGATITITNVDTGVKTPGQSNSVGLYSVRFLPIGTYTVTVAAPGFAEQTTKPFKLEINATVQLKSQLRVGTGTSIEVDSAAPILNTTDATLGITMSANEIANLPLNGRNFSSVTLFQPGAVNTDPTGMTGSNAIERATFSNDNASINGNRNQANNYLLDGIDLNEGQNNLIGYNPSPDAIAEIRVISANAPATYGNVNGGAVIALLKSGTNSFHGSAFGYLQNDKLNANSWTHKNTASPSDFTPRDRYTQALFGGTFGGRILRDKLFFFGDYQGARNHQGNTSFATVIPTAFRTGNFSSLGFQLYNTQNGYAPYANNQLTVSNPVALYLFAHPELYPLPNATPIAGTIAGNNYRAATKTFIVNNQFDIKIDYNLGTSDKISGFYAQSRAYDSSTPTIPVAFSSFNIYPTKLGGSTWVHTFSPAVVNEARVGFTRIRWGQGVPIDTTGVFGLSGDSVVGVPFGAQQYQGFARQAIADGISDTGNSASPQIYIDNTFTYGDNLTIQKGKHLFSVGATALRYQQQYVNTANNGALGSFTYSGLFTANQGVTGAVGYGPADFVLNRVASASIENGGEVGNRQWRVAGFFQDDWKVLPNLTLNLGVRYEYDQPWYEVNNKTANVLPNGTVEYAGSVPVGAPAGSIVCPTRACYNANYKQIMPRLGFALQATPRFVVRGGYGASSFFEGNSTNQRLTYNNPFVVFTNKQATTPTATSGGTPYTVQQGFSAPTGSVNTSSAGYGAWPQNIQPAYIQEFNLTTEYALSNTLSFTVGYVGETGQHIEDYRNGNQLLTPGNYATAPYAALVGSGGPLLVTESRAMMNYNALQSTLRQRATHGLEYTINYTYARAMTNSAGNYGVPGTTLSNGAFQNGYDSRADYGPAGQDVRNNLNAVIVYALPFGHGRMYASHINRVLDLAVGGWSLSSSVIAFTGVPVTLIGPDNSNSNSKGGARPNQYRKLKVVNRTVSNWFGTDPSATPCTTAVNNGVCAYGVTSGLAGNYFGTASVGTERAPGYYQIDNSLFKDFHITEKQSIGFRADAFNVLNHTNLSNPDNNIQDTSFGVITSTRGQERRLQLSANYKF